MCTPQLYSLSWGEHNSALLSTAKNLQSVGDMVDVTLSAGGQMFSAHKLVLSAASPLLMELLKSTECEHPVIILDGISPSDLETILQFIYQGEISVETGDLPSLIQAAQCLDITALMPITNPAKTPTLPLLNLNSRENKKLDPLEGFNVRKKRSKEMALVVDSEDIPSSPATVESNALDDGTEVKKPLPSELPVSCPICFTTIRQSRNLRRHMELIHLRNEGTRPPKKRRKADAAAGADCPSPAASVRDSSEDVPPHPLLSAAIPQLGEPTVQSIYSLAPTPLFQSFDVQNQLRSYTQGDVYEEAKNNS